MARKKITGMDRRTVLRGLSCATATAISAVLLDGCACNTKNSREFDRMILDNDPDPQPLQPTVLQQHTIVDMHCHVAGIGADDSGCYISPQLRKNFRYNIYLKAFGVDKGELQTHGDGLVIERLSAKLAQSQLVDAAVTLALDGVVGDDGALDYEKTEVYIPNSFVHREISRHDNLYFGASVNPYRPNSLELLEEAAENGAVLIKWLPPIQHIDPADPRITPFYDKLVELDLPLLSHTSEERSFTKARHELADPKKLEAPLRRGVKVIAAHVATQGKTEGQPDFERLLSLFGQYPNLYADISSLTQINKLGHLAKVLKHEELYPKLVYGTDMPLIATILVSPWYFPLDLSWKQIIGLSGVENPWDQDFLLKQALGVPEQIFTNSFDLLVKNNQ